MSDQDKDETTLTLHYGLYLFLRMLFGLTNARSWFQHAMDIVLSTFHREDVYIFPKSIE